MAGGNFLRKPISAVAKKAFGTQRGNGSRVREILERMQAEKAAKHGDEEFNPLAVAGRAAPEPPSQIIKPGDPGFDMGRMGPERSGIFDYDYKLPVRNSGVQRYQPKFGVPERTTDLLGRKDVFGKMVEGVERGMEATGGEDWYEAGPMFKSFIDEFGADEGQKRFDAFMTAVAGTSPRSDVGTNIRNASFYYGQTNPPPGTNMPPTRDFLQEDNPYPYGHLAQNLHRSNVSKTMFEDSPGFDYRKNPKPLSFGWNLRGDPNLVTVDTHAFRAPAMLGEDPRFLETSFLNEKGAKPRNIQKEFEAGQHNMEDLTKWGAGWQSKPRENEYGAWEDYYKRIADELGITPRAAQGGAWIGHGAMTGLESAPKPFMDFVEERILKTARERGMDPKDVWREAIRGVRPLTMDEKLLQDLPGASAVG